MVYGAINTQLPDTMMGISQMLGLPPSAPTVAAGGKEASTPVPMTMICLLYTSDAADE